MITQHKPYHKQRIKLENKRINKLTTCGVNEIEIVFCSCFDDVKFRSF